MSLHVQIADGLKSESERFLLQALIDQIPDFLFVKDIESRFTIANVAIAGAYGQAPADLMGKTDFDLHAPGPAQEFFAFEQELMTSGVTLFNMEESFPDSNGVRKWYSTTKVPLRDREGRTVGLIGVARDITERKLMQSFELQQAKILEMIAANAALGTVLSELVLLIESQLTRVKASILLFDQDNNRLHHGAAPSLPDAYNRAVDGLAVGPNVGSCGTAVYRKESVIVTDIQSDPLWIEGRALAESFALRSCWSTPIRGHDGRVMGTFALYSSEVRGPASEECRLVHMAIRVAGIAIERHRSEQKLVHLAHYDALTGLPNRVMFLSHLRAALSDRRAAARHVALLYIDLDGFKQVNDQFGHYFGDLLLAAVGLRLRAFMSERLTVYRLGGDEFAAIKSLDAADRERTTRLSAEIIAALSLPYVIEAHHISVGATIGVSIAPEDDDDADSLLRDADLALYQAKAEERGGVRFFEPVMNVRAQKRRALETDLRRALEAQEFQLYYQPLIDLASLDICGFEALLRWRHPTRGMVPPLDFIPIAEETGMIVELGEWALRQACAQAALWPPSVRIAVNLSPVQFKNEGLFQSVTSALSASGLAPGRLELEITESVILLDSEMNLALLHRIRDLGVQISLDDFGVGYSSLSYLRSFPFTKIKIDRSFVGDLENNPGCLAIIRAVTRLASDLEMQTTAEGVESQQQLEQLRREGCNQGQGFLFSRPLPAREASALLRKQSSAAAP